jgi:hypothetical protein
MAARRDLVSIALNAGVRDHPHAMTVLAKIFVTHKLCMLHKFGGKILSCTCPHV